MPYRLTNILMTIVRVVMVSGFVAMMVLTLFQVANRYMLGLPVFWTEEAIVLLLIWSTLLGLPVQLWEHKEIVVDFLAFPNAGVEAAKQWTGLIASIVFCLVLAWSGWEFAQRGWPVISPVLGFSRFWFFLPIPLSAVLSILALTIRPRGPSGGGFD